MLWRRARTADVQSVRPVSRIWRGRIGRTPTSSSGGGSRSGSEWSVVEAGEFGGEQ
jgi:hypothetical protein